MLSIVLVCISQCAFRAHLLLSGPNHGKRRRDGEELEEAVPYQSVGNRRNSVQFGVGRTVWAGTRPSPIPERILDMIPGGLAWLALLLVLVGAYFAPMAVVLGAGLLAFYSAVRFSLAGAANLLGLRAIKRWEAIDWQAEYGRRAAADSLPLDAVHHVVIIPNYREDFTTLRRTLDRLSRQRGAAASISIVLAMEVGEDGAVSKGEALRAEYADCFEHFLVATHPKGLPGEMQCKSANQAWAGRWARRAMVDELGYNIDHLVITTMDSDTLWHPDHFAALRVLFATDPRRYATFWQAPIRYHGNVWGINPLMRILHAYSSAWELAYLAAPWWQALPMSSYSMSLRLLDSLGYWDADVIADEWHMYIKAYFQRDGDIWLQPIFLPFYASATTGDSVIQAIKERYLQTLRHAWGAKEIGYTIAQMSENPQNSFRGGFNLLFRVAHDNLLAGFGWIVMMLGAQFPLLLHPDSMRDNLMTPPFLLLQISATVVSILTIIFWALDLRIRPARPAPWTKRERLLELASLPLVAVMTFLCVAMPVLHSQTRLMLGIPLQFRVAAKR